MFMMLLHSVLLVVPCEGSMVVIFLIQIYSFNMM
uniref:Uncharacterized protein n=1 Tax=Rhizophora mucronata TaxID=61149 RepID=A0A2P2IYQ1_RHIMU